MAIDRAQTPLPGPAGTSPPGTGRAVPAPAFAGPGPWLACGALAFLGVALGSVTEASLLPGWLASHDKLAHAGAYAALMGFLAHAFVGRRAWLAAALALAALGVGIEALQAFVPSRQAELADALANVAGVALAWALLGARALRG